MPRKSFALAHNKTSVALLVLALVVGGISAQATELIGQAPILVESGGVIPLTGPTVINSNINPPGHFICIDIKTKILFYGQFNTNAIWKRSI